MLDHVIFQILWGRHVWIVEGGEPIATLSHFINYKVNPQNP